MLGVDPPLIRQLGRTPTQKSLNEEKEDEYADVMNTGIKIIGRLCVNMWHNARNELNITSFTQENVAFSVLGERVPAYSHRDLTHWWQPPGTSPAAATGARGGRGGGGEGEGADLGPTAAAPSALCDRLHAPDGGLVAAPDAPSAAGEPAHLYRLIHNLFRRCPSRLGASRRARWPRRTTPARVLAYYACRVELTFVHRPFRAPQSLHVFGIDFTPAPAAQYRVESMMLRLCRTQGYAAATPNDTQIRAQGAPESVALVMEPEGKFYSSPVAVLDFRSVREKRCEAIPRVVPLVHDRLF